MKTEPELTLEEGKPSIFLLHAGTVNVVLNKNVVNATERLGELIDSITKNNPETLLVVAQLIPNHNGTANALVDAYNKQLLP